MRPLILLTFLAELGKLGYRMAAELNQAGLVRM